MAATTAIISAAATAYGAYNSMQARKDTERQAAQQREALAALEAKPIAVIPNADDDATKAARRRSIAGQMQRRGRQSTLLTDQDSGGDALGV